MVVNAEKKLSSVLRTREDDDELFPMDDHN